MRISDWSSDVCSSDLHDLAFLFELERAAAELQPKPHVAISSINRGADKAGFCRNEAPFKARRVNDIAASLTRQLENERFHFEQGDPDEWRKTVKSIGSSLRDTWEIAEIGRASCRARVCRYV